MKLSRSIVIGSMKFQFVDYATKNYSLVSSGDGSGRIEAKNIYSHHIEFMFIWCKECTSLQSRGLLPTNFLKICTK